MQNIASENNLAGTAFVVKTDNGYDLRWFTPNVEIDLCGHATLARDMLILLETEEQIKILEVDIEKIKNVTECFAFIITASSLNSGYDFVSRFLLQMPE